MRAYKANMIPGGTTPVINVSQYDNDYAVTVTLIEGAEIYTPPAGATIRVEGTKPDGHGFEYPCTYQGNVVTMPIYTQMTAVAGRFPIELVVYQSGLRVGSCNIIFAVERAPLGEGTDISETVIPDIIAGAQAQADAAAASATQAASSAASAETAKDAAMDASQDAIDAAQELQTAIQFNAALIHATASGAVASFADGADNIPMQSVVAEITPVQSGSGDPVSPTNIRPISGRTGMTVTRAGKNLLHNDWVGETVTVSGLTGTVANDGTITINGTATASGILLANMDAANSSTATQNRRKKTLPNGTYKFVGHGNGINLQVRGTNSEAGNADTGIAASNVGSGTFVIDDTYKYNWVRLAFTNGTVANNLKVAPMIIPADVSDTTFEPYTATEYPITWESIAGTVYGGTLDVVSGVLTVDMALVTFNSLPLYNDDWTNDSTIAASSNKLTPLRDNARRADAVCNMLPNGISVGVSSRVGGATVTTPCFGFNSVDGYGKWIYFRFLKSVVGSTLEELNTYLSENPVSVAYVMETPQTYQLTGAEVRTLLGVNNLWSDAGDVSVEYVADTKMYIDKRIAELQALILEH